jgi:DivIVA domain-containing protein
MGQLLLLLAGVLVVAIIGFGVVVLITSSDPGLAPAEPDGRAVPLPTGRPLVETDLKAVRFDTALRGYRMSQVDAALRRAAYDVGYKDELVTVLMAEVDALRVGRLDDADLLREAREQALAGARPAAPGSQPAIVIPSAETGTGGDADSDAEVDAALDGEPRPEAERAEPAGRAEPAEPAGRAEPAEPAEPELGSAAEREPDEPPDWSVELDDSWRRSAMGGR